MDSRTDVLVIGAGVCGLITALQLAEDGYPVRVIARELPQESTSCAAGAIWGPYMVENDLRILPWSEETRLVLNGLAGTPGTGVRVVYGLEAARGDVEIPEWATTLDGFRRARPDEVPAGFSCGWWYTAPIVEMPLYLAYLQRLAEAAGVPIERRAIESLDEATGAAPIVVNCTGVDARTLAHDDQLTPTRGQLVVVENPGVEEFFAEHDETPTPTYYLPQGPKVVLGGSAHDGETDRVPDPKISREIIERCAEIEPRLRDAKVLAHRVGLRPMRPSIRLEIEEAADGHVIHNYGHGGAGVTTSWGCAREVSRLVEKLAP
jgi:D-amino-acid oxidase